VSGLPRPPWPVRVGRGRPPAGMVITEPYKGEDVQVKILAGGFEFEG
jgi:hypothetical protein